MNQTLIVPIWGTLEEHVIAMFLQDLITIGLHLNSPVIGFHNGADPIDVSRLMPKIHSAGFKTLYPLPQGKDPSEVWIYTSGRNQARCPPEFRSCRVRTRMLEQPAARPANTFKPQLPKHGFDPIIHNDPMPPLRVNIPHSGAPAWMAFSRQELNRLNGKS